MTKQEHEEQARTAKTRLEKAKEAEDIGQDPNTVSLQAKLDAANAKLLKFGVGKDIEEGVRLRMDLGLSREDAITCARRQSATDAVLAKKGLSDTELRNELIAAGSLH